MMVIVIYIVDIWKYHDSLYLRIDKGSLGAALYLGTWIHNYCNCNIILNIV